MFWGYVLGFCFGFFFSPSTFWNKRYWKFSPQLAKQRCFWPYFSLSFFHILISSWFVPAVRHYSSCSSEFRLANKCQIQTMQSWRNKITAVRKMTFTQANLKLRGNLIQLKPSLITHKYQQPCQYRPKTITVGRHNRLNYVLLEVKTNINM